MLNINRDNQKFWIITLMSTLMLILILEQRNNNKLLNNIQHALMFICKEDDFYYRKLITFLSMPADKIVNIDQAKLYVPNFPVDFIQSQIVVNGRFFEHDILQELQPYIKENAIILDIGANIGNHSVYWATTANIKRIYAFEPLKEIFCTLRKNVEINKLGDRVKAFNIGLSNQKINGSISFYNHADIGRTALKQNVNGNLLLDKLDNIKIEEDAVDFVKIDVEGHELEVLQGARETLLKYKPMIFIEIFPENKTKVHEYLINLGYRLEKSFRDCNYLYLFNKKNN